MLLHGGFFRAMMLGISAAHATGAGAAHSTHAGRRIVTHVSALEQHKDASKQGGYVFCSCCAHVTPIGKACKLCGYLLTLERQRLCREHLAS